MKRGESGITVLEMVVAFCLSSIIALGAAAFTFHALRTTANTRDHLAVVSNAETAGYWISRDANMADNVITDNLTPPAILVLNWTEWGYGEENTYYTATYSVENLSGEIGQIMRRYQVSDGTDLRTLVASHVYYNPSDPLNSTSVTYQNPSINLKVSTQSGSVTESRSYQICRRPNF